MSARALSGRPVAFAALVWASTMGSLLFAQNGPKTYRDDTDVIFVEVPVNVVDREGKPVAGLELSDFQILDEGRPRQLESAERIDLAALDPSAGPMAARRAAERLPAAGRRHFLLLFDLAFSRPAALEKARRAARQFALESLHPTDLAAVATYSHQRGVELLVTFSPDRAQLARAIDNLGSARQLGQASDPLGFLAPQALAERSFADGGSPGQAGRSPGANPNRATGIDSELIAGKQLEQSGKALERVRVSNWARALSTKAEILGRIEGRKQVLYFSEGFDGRLLLGRQGDPRDPQVEQDSLLAERGFHWLVDTDDLYGSNALQGDIEAMLEKLRRADCVLQAIDISGLASTSAPAARIDRAAQDALFYMARSSGGDLFEDANRLGAQLEAVLDRSRLTYLLSFRADDLPQDGSYRRLEVQLTERADRPAVRVSHRPGYYAPRPFAELHPLEKRLLAANALASAEPRREIGLDLLAAPFRAGAALAYVPVILEASGPDLVQGHRGSQLEIEIYTYVTDADGNLRDHFSQVVKMGGHDAAERLGRGLKFYGHLELESGSYLVRSLVRNAETGRTGSRSFSLEVPRFDPEEPVILPPFFPDAAGSWLLVRERIESGDNASDQTRSGGVSSVIYPFTFAGEPFVPAALPSLPSGLATAYLIGFGLPTGQLTLNGVVLDAGGEVVLTPQVKLLERSGTEIEGRDKLRIELQLSGLPAGEYTLQIELRGGEAGRPAGSSAPFRIHPRLLR